MSMKEIINEKNGKVIITVSDRKWEKDDMWRNRITKNLTAAGFKFTVKEVE